MPRKNVSFDDPIEERANWLIQQRGFSGLSNLLEVLIREEYERRHPGTVYPAPAPASAPMHDAPASSLADTLAMAKAAGKRAQTRVPHKTKRK